MIDYQMDHLPMVITTEDITDVPTGTLGMVLWFGSGLAYVDFSPFNGRIVDVEKLRYANGLDIVMGVVTNNRKEP